MNDAAAPAGKTRVTLKLFASLTEFLPEKYRRAHEMPMLVDPDTTIEGLLTPFGLPPKMVKLVVLNGVFVPASERATTRFNDGDALAIWPPVAGG